MLNMNINYNLLNAVICNQHTSWQVHEKNNSCPSVENIFIKLIRRLLFDYLYLSLTHSHWRREFWYGSINHQCYFLGMQCNTELKILTVSNFTHCSLEFPIGFLDFITHQTWSIMICIGVYARGLEIVVLVQWELCNIVNGGACWNAQIRVDVFYAPNWKYSCVCISKFLLT